MSTNADSIAEALPGYDIGEEIGRGGMGVVRSGVHRSLGRIVAIKELPAGLAHDPKVRARFVAEGRMLAMLDHPHIVPVYDYVERDGLCLLVMEQLTGGSIWDRFEADGYRHDQVCAITIVTAVALHHAHGKGLLHRDIKPANVLVSSSGLLKVTDFGIAQVVGGGETMATATGQLLGTPGYMAPEQAEGKELGPTADVYATGMVAYQLLSGMLPYSEDGGALAIVYRHVYEDPRPLAEVAPDVAPEVCDVVMRAIARAPGDRFPTAEALARAMDAAATSAFGPQWLAATGITLIAPEFERANSTPAPPRAESPATVIGAPVPLVRPGVVGPAPAPIDLEHEVLVPVQEVAASAAPPTPTPTPVSSSPPPSTSSSSEAAGRSGRSIAGPIGAVLLAASITVAVVGLGATTTGGTLGDIAKVSGQGLTDGPVDVDLGEPIEVQLVVPPDTSTGPAMARLTIDVAGLRRSGIAPLGPGGTPSGNNNTPSTIQPGTNRIPDVRGETADQAGVILRRGGWNVARRTEPNPNVPAGIVIRTRPPAGEVLAGGETVTIFVSMGSGQPGNATGLTQLAPVLVVDKQAVATIDLSGADAIAAGTVRAELELLNRAGEVMGRQSFTVRPIGGGLATLLGLLALVLLVGSIGLGGWRFRKPGAVPTMVGLGAIFGASVSVVAWAAGAGTLSMVTVGLCAVLAAAGGGLVVDFNRR